MATQPEPHPDSPPQETPPLVPDEIEPIPGGGGDIDYPDSTPNEDPGSPGKSPPNVS